MEDTKATTLGVALSIGVTLDWGELAYAFAREDSEAQALFLRDAAYHFDELGAADKAIQFEFIAEAIPEEQRARVKAMLEGIASSIEYQ